MTEKDGVIFRVLQSIESSLENGVFLDVENELVELKDLSTGNEWTSLKQTVCAFLNTKGGYIIGGIRERNKEYSFPGFDRNNEGRLIELQTKVFTNDQQVKPDLSDHIFFDYRTIQNKTLVIISVKPLIENEKYVQYDEEYYERILTQDKKIAPAKLEQHREYKAELEYAKEIAVVPNAVLADLDIDKINQFILKINTSYRKETIKQDLADAADFLRRRYCINADGAVTVMGLLLFGKEPFLQLEYRAEIDCYFETGNQIGRDKRYFQNDVLNLMEDAFSFVWGHIKVGRSYVGGGRSEPEFPEKLVREVINNAFAHRDYVANQFITIKINPGQQLEITNPGSFKRNMLMESNGNTRAIRRVIPGVPETKNPKLANVLKAFDKIESQGIGMATLVSLCLENQIDVPYYNLSRPDTISLIIPSGKLMDDETVRWFSSFQHYIKNKLGGKFSQDHLLVLAYLLKSERLNLRRNYTILLSPSNNHFDVLNDLEQAGLVSLHPIASTEQTPVYIIDATLTKDDFIPEMEISLGKWLSVYDDVTQKVLNILFRHQQYNHQSLKPSMITPELYYQLHGKEINPITYETLGRRVRKICGELLKADILIKMNDKSYRVREEGLGG